MTKSTSSNLQVRYSVDGEPHTQQPDGAYCIVTRIEDSTYRRLAECSYPVTRQISFRREFGDDTLNIAQYYVGLRWLFGKPGRLYDDWKGSFSFAFKIDVFRNGKTYPYLLHLVHLRSTVDFLFSKIVANPESHNLSDLNVHHVPLEDEFSGREIITVEYFIYGFLKGYLSSAKKYTEQNMPEFALITESNCIISGYVDGEIFEHYFDDEEDFEAETTLFQHLIKNPVAEWPGDTDEPAILTVKFDFPEDEQ